jgi:ABC-type Fe3+ transport system permease subunit
MTNAEALVTIIGILIIFALPLLYIIVRSIYIGNWRHLSIDNEWDASKSRGRIKK